MNARSKGHVPCRSAIDLELSGFWPLPGIAVGGCEECEDFAASGDRNAPQSGVDCRSSEKGLDCRFEPQGFFERRAGKTWVCMQFGVLIGEVCQAVQCIPDAVDGCVNTGRSERTHQHGRLLMGDFATISGLIDQITQAVGSQHIALAMRHDPCRHRLDPRRGPSQ